MRHDPTPARASFLLRRAHLNEQLQDPLLYPHQRPQLLKDRNTVDKVLRAIPKDTKHA